jgi:hypothetical protein
VTDLAPTRHTADSINDDDLDQLYADLAHAQAEAARWAEAESADVAAGSYAGRVEELQTVIDRVAALRDDLRGITGARYIADMLDKILDEQPDPAATEATQPADWLYAGTRDLNIPAAPVPYPACTQEQS